MKIKFYGTRGSLPAPLDAKQVQGKMTDGIEAYSKYVYKTIENNSMMKREDHVMNVSEWLVTQPFFKRATYGGETTCCVVSEGDTRLVFDMGSGLRKFGNDLLGEMFKANKGFDVHFFMSHIHWDQIQGFPFFAPLFFPKSKFDTKLFMYGGTTWGKKLEEVLAGQMDSPVFPVEFSKVRQEGPSIEFPETVYNGFEIGVGSNELVTIATGEHHIVDRFILKSTRLHHPNETYGWRLVDPTTNKVFVYATDTEPYYGGVDKNLVALAKDADVLYLDGQYYDDQYTGKVGGVPRVGWGHGTVESCAEVAKAANVKKLIIGHHDPASTDERIWQNEQLAKAIFPNTECAYDGMEVEI